MVSPVYDHTSPIYPVIRELLLWIEHDLSRPLALGDIATRAGYSKWHLQRAFKQLTGYRLASYIRMRRLTTAAELLKSTTLQVSEIYTQVGYEEGSTFCRAFYSHFGFSPTEYRGQSGKEPQEANLITQLNLPAPGVVPLHYGV